jgi:RecA-family ATPase
MQTAVDRDALCRAILEQKSRDIAEAQKIAHEAVAARTSWTVDELLSVDFPQPRWIVPGILPVGLASLAGRPKLGKSWLALQLAIAVASGGRFLDVKVDTGPVLYLALEDSPRRLKSRLEALKATAGVPLQFHTDWLPLNGEAGGMEDLHRRASKMQPRLIIIDTLARSFTSRVDWNDLGGTTGAMGALQSLALDRDLCVLCVDHHRKVGPMTADVIDDILGSTGKSAVVDTAWGLYRKRGEAGATLRVVGRDVDERELALEFRAPTGCWKMLGDARDVAAKSAQDHVLSVLQMLKEGDANTVAREAELSRQTTRKHLERLCATGDVERREELHRGRSKIIYVPIPMQPPLM